MTEHQIADLIEEGADLKAEIDERTKRLREINAILATAATFPEGKSTAHLVGCRFKAKVQRKETTEYDQALLGTAREALGDQTFFALFGWEYKPKAKKELDGFIKYDPRADVVLAAMTKKAGSPSVTYELLEEV